jgi:acylphosphatase
MSQSCRRFLVSGRVQGVWFRESTRREAVKLNLRGRAVNLPDGRVEVLAEGRESDIEALASWLQQGPPMARVEQVAEEIVQESGLPGFTTA